MSGSTPRYDADILRAVVIATGLAWSIAFVVVAVGYGLELYADGAMFSYAVAAQDVWAFHWHNISARSSVFFLTLWPAEAYVGLTGDPVGGMSFYGFLFYIAPLLGLAVTYIADHSHNRTIFTFACSSTALLCPLVFGFPTEMWVAHALFWPTLAISHYARPGINGTALVFITMLALVLTHEGALVLALGIVLTLALRGFRSDIFLRAACVLIAVLTIWVAVKIFFPPGEYFAVVLKRAARHFFDLTIFRVRIVLSLIATLAGYGFASLLYRRLVPAKAHLYAAATVAVTLVFYWMWFDPAVHASNRYYLRTALVVITPMLGTFACVFAIRREKIAMAIPGLGRVMMALTGHSATQVFLGGFLLVTLIYAVETARFVTAWKHYKTEFAWLAASGESDPTLGDPRFISSTRISTDLNRLTWFSTTPYLSVILGNLKPNRLVVDPRANYFWLSCDTATANYEATRSIPATSRGLVRTYSCLHR